MRVPVVVGGPCGEVGCPTLPGVRFRRLLIMSLLTAPALVGVVGCTVSGGGATSACQVDGCVITFDRGVSATASVLGVEAKLVAVNGDTVVLSVAGQQVTVPVGQTRSTSGLGVTVQQVTRDKVVVRVSSGISGGN